VHGPSILASYLQIPSAADRFGYEWQYNSQSDRHSQVGCWGVAFDLLNNSALLRQHAQDGKVVLGVNHSMRDFQTSRQKKLDLVIARSDNVSLQKGVSFKTLATRLGLSLTTGQQATLSALPDIQVGRVSAVLVALEAKAAMTAHNKARPRLYDELNSSHQCVHGASSQALAIAYVQINASERFVSSVSNRFPKGVLPPVVNPHVQPKAVNSIIDKIRELPRRTGTAGNGFDGIGVTVLHLENDGSPISVVSSPPAPQPGDDFHYDAMIVRMAHEYDSRFHSI
jgi:hypothetical protein